MTRHLVFGSYADAVRALRALDESLGFPKASSKRKYREARDWVLGGRTGPAPKRGITLTASEVLKHPTKELYSLDVTRYDLDAIPFFDGMATLERTDDWLPEDEKLEMPA